MKLLLLLIPLLAGFAHADEPFTAEESALQSRYDINAKAEGWTFSYDVRNLKRVGKEWGLGYIKRQSVGKLLSLGRDEKLKSWDIENFAQVTTPTLNQASCGSCVYFSFTWNFMKSLRLRKIEIPELSPQDLMNCSGEGGQCGGAMGPDVASGLVKMGGLHSMADYPYTASSGSCKTKPGPRYGQIKAYHDLDGSVRSILSSLHQGVPVSVGVAAGGSFGSYKSGIYNACNASGVNHYVVITKVDCGTSVDKDGYCIFDAKGNLPPGVGSWKIKNSWSESYGDHGYIEMVITTKSGQRCHSVAMPGDAQVLDIGVPMPEEKPVSFNVENDSVKLNAVVQPNQRYKSDDAKAALQNAINAVR